MNYGFYFLQGGLEIKTKEILIEIPGNIVDSKCNNTLPQFDTIPSKFDEVSSQIDFAQVELMRPCSCKSNLLQVNLLIHTIKKLQMQDESRSITNYQRHIRKTP